MREMRKDVILSEQELVALARETFDYEPGTGALYYKAKKRGERPITRRAGSILYGRRQIKFAGVTWPATWVVWLHQKGFLPKEELDHRNKQAWDDRVENLREATRSQNCINRDKGPNQTGYRGVKRNHKKFSASLVLDQKLYFLGTYNTAEEAAQVYDKYARELFGEFALLNFSDMPKRDWLFVGSW